MQTRFVWLVQSDQNNTSLKKFPRKLTEKFVELLWLELRNLLLNGFFATMTAERQLLASCSDALEYHNLPSKHQPSTTTSATASPSILL